MQVDLVKRHSQMAYACRSSLWGLREELACKLLVLRTRHVPVPLLHPGHVAVHFTSSYDSLSTGRRTLVVFPVALILRTCNFYR